MNQSSDRPPRTSGQIYLHGNVVACACERCGAPMSIRTVLMLADCWRCGASVELSPEQEAEVLRLIEQQEQAEAAVEETEQAEPVEPVAKAAPAPPPPAPAPPIDHLARFRGEADPSQGPGRKRWSPRERW